MPATRRICAGVVKPKDAPPFSKSSFLILKTAWQKIKEHYTDSGSLATTTIQELPPLTSSQYDYIPLQIREEFEKTNQTGIESHVELGRGRKAHIFMLESSSTPKPKSVVNGLPIVVAWLRFASTIASLNCSTDLNIYILATDVIKRLPSDPTDTINQIHVNTAFTNSCSLKNDIFIYRREEWFKAFIHETFHCMGLDFSAEASAIDFSTEYILSVFPALDPTTDVRLYETFCEMWAELFYLAFRVFYHRDNRFLDFSTKKYREALLREQIFSIYQSNKILKRLGGTFEDLFVENGSLAYREKTQVFCYHILKSALLWNTDEFLKWCRTHLSGSTPMQFDANKIQDYCLLVKQSALNENYQKAVVRLRSSKDSCGLKMRRTLRMTSPESA